MAKRIEVVVGELHLSARVAGSPGDSAMVLLHGWPLSSAIWEPVLEPLGTNHFVLAFDLPGVGASTGGPAPTLKSEIAAAVIAAAERLGAHDIMMAGVDVGGMIAFAAARDHGTRIGSATIMNTVIPGVEPWQSILANPHIWHFAFHQIPALPETLVRGRERAYFDFFFDFLAGDKSKIDDRLRQEMVDAYARPHALETGFDWYRAMPRDAETNCRPTAIETPILYLRGDADGRSIQPYLDGLVKAGAKRVKGNVVAGSGEILSIEAPESLVVLLQDFARETSGRS
jgi:pimeloyl-ACP methyl ester carboxylesterase